MMGVRSHNTAINSKWPQTQIKPKKIR